MKKILIFAIAMLTVSMAMAVPAHPGTATVVQPDGTSLTIRLCGDEYLHFNTTADGYTIVKRADGCYVYAQKDASGQLAPTPYVAHNADERTTAERLWLEDVDKHLMPTMTPAAAREQQAELARRAKTRQAATSNAPEYDYNNFLGLIILVQFNDREFSRSDYASMIDNMVNQRNYSGYDNTQMGRYTGSVNDYFYDNSNGQFSPAFDIIGPVTIDHSQFDANGTSNAAPLTVAAIDAADSLVDYSHYDRDGDGVVDMVFFLFAGIGSNIGGNDSRLIWPHASYIYTWENGNPAWVVRDGVGLGRYACSTELHGTNTWSIIDGIGVICHEFGHVLGLPDLYDTDYEKSGGDSPHPGEWTIMAGGGYQNNGRTPAGYSLYERYALGFAMPQLISEEGDYTLEPIGTSNEGYRLNTPVKKEFFLIENRQKTSKWDQYLPGHGMLVFRVDSTNANPWNRNEVNNNPKHNYFTLIRAGGTSDSQARSSDPFPGTNGVTLLNNDTEPANLLTWNKRQTPLGLERIAERSGVVSFSVIDVNVLKTVSLPQSLTIAKGLTLQLKPERYPESAPYKLQWFSTNEAVATVNADGQVITKAEGEANIIVVGNDNEAISSTCHVSVVNETIAASIADYRALAVESEANLLLNDALVVFTANGTAYLRDATAAIAIDNKTLALEVGDCLNGYLFGRVSNDGYTPKLTAVDGRTNDLGYSLTKGNAVKPTRTSVADASQRLYGDLVTLEAAAPQNDGGLWVMGGDNRIRLYNTFKVKGISVPKNYQGKYYDITGIYITNKLTNGTIINELALTQNFEEVDAPSGVSTVMADGHEPAQVFTTDGRLVAHTTIDAIAQLPLRRGVYVVKTATRAWRFAK
ncbi:MAG: M6 family metalloprotease domain-containing protein [Prevotella sp.]|nr:M6 family metalloprotease domain-containing protein [Prevotella sp.]